MVLQRAALIMEDGEKKLSLFFFLLYNTLPRVHVMGVANILHSGLITLCNMFM